MPRLRRGISELLFRGFIAPCNETWRQQPISGRLTFWLHDAERLTTSANPQL